MLLPPELINHIFSFLRGDASALNACSNAYPLFSRLAERHLFTDIVVRLSDQLELSELHNRLTKNSRMLLFPRTLKIIGVIPFVAYPPLLPIISMIPQMVNLFSFCLYGPGTAYQENQSLYEEFMSTLRESLQQSSIEQCCHHHLAYVSSASLEPEDESTSDARFLRSLESFTITGLYSQDILFWATHYGPSLMPLDYTYSIDPRESCKLVTACPNSLTSLHITLGNLCQGLYRYDTDGHVVDHWFDDDEDFPFSLSSLTRLEKLSIFTEIESSDDDESELHTAVPAIIRLIKTAPSIQHIILNINYSIRDVAFIGYLDHWSPLDDLRQSDFSGNIRRPRIDIYISGKGIPSVSDESTLDSLTENKVLRDLVKRGVVTLMSGIVIDTEGI